MAVCTKRWGNDVRKRCSWGGYEQSSCLVQGHAVAGHDFGAMKFVASLASYVVGIPGGLFSLELAIGAGVGHNLSVLMPSVDPRALMVLGMCA